jgi:hypothetical protein
MPQNKRQIKLTTILLLTIILISQFFLISLAKTEVYFSFFYNSISPALQKPEVQTININTASQDELTNILQISKPLAQKIITLPFMSFPRRRESIILREELGGFKDPQALTQLFEITNLEWEEWKDGGITIRVK